MKRGVHYDFHSFYCMKCGQKILDLPRARGKQSPRFHRKKLYCFNCGIELNAIECKNEQDVYDFKCKFENGEFKAEVEESIKYINEN